MSHIPVVSYTRCLIYWISHIPDVSYTGRFLYQMSKIQDILSTKYLIYWTKCAVYKKCPIYKKAKIMSHLPSYFWQIRCFPKRTSSVGNGYVSYTTSHFGRYTSHPVYQFLVYKTILSLIPYI